jgi:nicotinamidase-related amidase
VPVLLTVQYLKGLGPTVPEIKAVTEGATELEKTSFSAWDDEPTREWIQQTGRKTIALCGDEAHVCVMQTAIDLLAAGYTVAVVADCVASRKSLDKKMALKRLRAEGAIVTTYESFLLELLRGKANPAFKAISQIAKEVH